MHAIVALLLLLVLLLLVVCLQTLQDCSSLMARLQATNGARLTPGERL
jgi:hypothetical protein